MYFEVLLDAVLGQREILHEMECSICGFNEVFYLEPQTGVQIGRACQGCNFVQKFDLPQVK